MKTTNKITTILLKILFLTSCQSKFIPVADISIHFNRCQVLCYDYKNLKIVDDKNCNKKISENYKPFYSKELDGNAKEYLRFNSSSNYPIEYCDKVFGFYLEDFAKKVKPELNKEIQRCKNARNK